MPSMRQHSIIPWLVSMIFAATAVQAKEANTSEVVFACDAGGVATLFVDSVRPKLKSNAVQQPVAWRDTVSLTVDDDGRHFSVHPLRPIRLVCGSGDSAIDFVVTAAWDTDLREVPMEGVPMWPSVRVERHGRALVEDVALTMCAAPPPADRRNCAVTIFGYISSAQTPRVALHRMTIDWIQ